MPLTKSAASWVTSGTSGTRRSSAYRETSGGTRFSPTASAFTRKNNAASADLLRPPRVSNDHSRDRT